MRLAVDQWNAEIDKACLMGYVYMEMTQSQQFPEEVLQKVYLGMVEGCLDSPKNIKYYCTGLFNDVMFFLH